MKYLVIIEKIKNNYSAYLPDVSGCIATGKTIEETKSSAHVKMARRESDSLERECIARNPYKKNNDTIYNQALFIIISIKKVNFNYCVSFGDFLYTKG